MTFSRTIHHVALAAGAICTLLTSGPAARAEVVTLIDRTRIYGTLLHYYDGEITIQTPDGVRVRIPSAKVRRIQFRMPKPRPAFSSPTKTFNRWKQTLLRGDIAAHIECYAMMYQMMMTNLMGAMSRAELAKMRQGHRHTRYVIQGVRHKGKRLAFLKVSARMPGMHRPQVGELLFVLENGEWKLVPPQFQRPAAGPPASPHQD